jgi:hypothetical protein
MEFLRIVLVELQPDQPIERRIIPVSRHEGDGANKSAAAQAAALRIVLL